MKARPVWMVMFLVGAACSNPNSGDNNNDNPDARVFLDAPPTVPQMITISGHVSERSLTGETAVSGVAIGVNASSNESTALVTTMTNAQGDFTLTFTTDGMPLDGFVKATKSGYVDLYLYPAGPFIADFPNADVNMLTPSNKDFLNNLAGGGQMAGKGLIGLQVRDASGNPVAGATVSSMPASGAYRYTGSDGLPSSSAMVTSSEGVAFMFNVPSGPITVTASKTGMTFKSHTVIARPDKFTTTSILQ